MPAKRSKPSSNSEPKKAKRAKRSKSKVISDCESDANNKPAYDYDPTKLNFNLMMSLLEGFQKKHGHVHVPESHLAQRLGPWVAAMRCQAFSGKLKDSQIRRLREIGVLLNGQDEIWRVQYQKLQDYQEQHSHCHVHDDAELAAWTRSQRALHRQGKLSADRKALLESIGFDWNYQKPQTFVLPTSDADKDIKPLAGGIFAAAMSWMQ